MHRRPGRVAVLALGLDRESVTSRRRQLYDGIREAILTGRVLPGTRIPSTRALADDLGCSRNTAAAAYEQLQAEGYLETRVGAGTIVAASVPEASLQVRAPRGIPPTRHRRRGISRRGGLLLRARAALPPLPPSRPFRLGVPAFDVTACNAWARLVARWARGMPRRVFEYGDPAGYPPLRHAIAAYLREARGVRCDADQVVVVSGSQQGIDLAARVLLDAGDRVGLEDPGYPGARAAFAAAGARLQPIAVDREGFRVDVAARRAPGARLVYVTPSHQFPLGVRMSPRRRVALLQWATRTGAARLRA